MADTAYISAPRHCDIHTYILGEPDVFASYDKRTRTGQWANVCEDCFRTETDGILGTGYGQRLIVGTKPPRPATA